MSWLRLPRWTGSWLLNCLYSICSCCFTEKQSPFQEQFLSQHPWQKYCSNLTFWGSLLSHQTLTLRRRASLEVSLTESNTFRSVRHFTFWNSLQKKKKKTGERVKRRRGHKVRTLCKLPSLAIEMKVSLNNPVKCSEIPLRGLWGDLQPSVFFVSPSQDNADTWVHVH